MKNIRPQRRSNSSTRFDKPFGKSKGNFRPEEDSGKPAYVKNKYKGSGERPYSKNAGEEREGNKTYQRDSFHHENKREGFYKDRKPGPSRYGSNYKGSGSGERYSGNAGEERNEKRSFKQDSFHHENKREGFYKDRKPGQNRYDNNYRGSGERPYSGKRDEEGVEGFEKHTSQHPYKEGYRKGNWQRNSYGRNQYNKEENTFKKEEDSEQKSNYGRPYKKERLGFKKSYRDQDKFSGKEKYDENRKPYNPDFKKNPYSKKKQLEYKQEHPEKEWPMRLNRFIANAGICSRREADELIVSGLVSVNGEIITRLGTKVKQDDEVRYNGERIKSEKKVYILLNKPKDYITTVEDAHAKRTVLDLVQGACKERVYPVGRLDRNTTGVLLLTNDGDLTKKLTHPSFNKKKVYLAYLDRPLTAADLMKIADGVTLEDGFVQPDAVSYVDEKSKNQIGIEIHSGKNHIVRRIFESLGYDVTKLDRVMFAGLTKKGLQRGQWRFLSEKEVVVLKMGSYE